MASTPTPAPAKCYKLMPATSNGVWQHDNPVDFAFPLLVIQIIIVLAVTRFLAYIFKPLKQPRVIGEIIGGILLGPTALSRNKNFKDNIFPKQSLTVLDTVAGMGLVFFLFLVGLELDLKAIRRVGKQALAVAVAGMTLPFAVGAGVSVVIYNSLAHSGKFAPFLVFMGVAMSITAFPVLARILAERKLLTTDVGQMAMSAAAVNDVTAWILLALAVALSGSNTKETAAIWVLLCGAAFVLFMFVVVKPFMSWMAYQSMEDKPIKELYVCITFALVLASAFTTDAIGIHSIFGGFVLGLIIPKEGFFAQNLIEKIEDFVSTLLLPLYFASSGLKTNVATISGAKAWGLLVLVISVACFGKITGSVAVSQFYTKNWRKSFAIGILMNTKGLVELIVLNIGKDRGVLSDEVFAIMVLMAIFTTCITTPILMAIYKPARNHIPYTRRQLYHDVAPKEDLRILSCVQGIRNVPAMINLTETVRGQTKRTVRLYILHLTELSERSSAIMMVQRARRDGRPFWDDSGENRTDRIVVGFEAFQRLSKVIVRPMTAISEFENMHEDICTTAEDKRASIIILPFHKQLRIDGAFQIHDSHFRGVNRKVLQHAPCSVGILIDRGLWGASQVAPDSVNHSATVLFFGGRDDREALAFGMRMAEHPGVKLRVIRFTADLDLDSVLESPQVPPRGSLARASSRPRAGLDFFTKAASGSTEFLTRAGTHASSRYFFAPEINIELERQQDDEILSFLRDPRENVSYEEIEITDLEESVLEVGKSRSDLILVGRNHRAPPILAALALNRNIGYSELGPVGDVLTSPTCRTSVLVIQQYDSNPSSHATAKVDREVPHLETSREGVTGNPAPAEKGVRRPNDDSLDSPV